MPSQTTHCSAPAKLILSGEHAVLYHCPALSASINLRTYCRCHFHPSPHFSITIKLVNFNYQASYHEADYLHQATLIEARYQDYQRGALTISSVLTKPEDLILITLYLFAQQRPFKDGSWQIEIDSEIPLGRGLGSSASVIVSLLLCLNKQQGHRTAPSLSQDELLTLAQQIESRQHGKSSGLDPATILFGGTVRYRMQHPIEPLPSLDLNQLSAWLIDTGKPASSTGDTVNWVKHHHADNTELWQAFSKISTQITHAIDSLHWPLLHQSIKDNHQLLMKIGVVPDKTAEFVTHLEQRYSASVKICGAGSIAGHSAGILLCISEQNPLALCREWGYPLYPLEFDSEGGICSEQDN